jgi:pimeloyl-ACP methyl ester carboxylesterase
LNKGSKIGYTLIQAKGEKKPYPVIKTVQSYNSAKDIRPKLENCTIPALIMRGQCDAIKWGYVTEYLDLFTIHRLIIVPDAGHSIAREQPDL